MRQKVFTLILFLFALQVSHAQWKSEPPAPPEKLECGVEFQSSTWGEGNNMFGYNDCLPAGADPHNGFDRDYQFEIVGEITDVRFTFEADCPKSIFLLDANKECIEFSTIETDRFADIEPAGLKVTKTFLGSTRLNPGVYHLIVDGPESSTCDAYTLKMDCTPYEPFTICEFGGDISSCNATITDTLPEIEQQITPVGPAFFDANFVVCQPAESFKIYQAFFDNPGTITADLIDATEGTEVLIYSDDCACISDILCFNGDDCGEGEGVGQYSDTRTLANAQSGFYYFVVTGPADATYGLKVVTNDCLCDFNEEIEPIDCGQTITADAATEANKFDNVPAQGANAYENCYGRDRPYTGGDKVYQFEVFSQTKVTITLTSFFNAGLFLFDANCATDCLTYEESTGINGQAIINSFEIPRGVYQIIVDLEEPHAASCPFTITLECETVPANNQLVAAAFDDGALRHNVHIPSSFKLNNKRIIDGNKRAHLAYFADGENCVNANVEAPARMMGSPISFHILKGKENENIPGDVYVIEDPLRVQLTALGETTDFLDVSYAILEDFTDNAFSGFHSASSLFADPDIKKKFRTSSIDRGLSSAGGRVTFKIFANDSGRGLGLDWCIAERPAPPGPNGESFEQINIRDIIPGLSGQGYQEITVVFGPNTGTKPKRTILNVTGTTINKTIPQELMQKGAINCQDSDAASPQIICNSTQNVTIDSLIRITLLADHLKDIGVITDDCSTGDDLEVKITPNNLANLEVGESQQIQVTATDASGKKFSCLDMTITATKSKRLRGRSSNLNTTISPSNLNTPLSIVPNPNNGLFNLFVQPIEEGIHDLSVFNAFGKRVKQVSLNLGGTKQNISIEMQDFAKGMYFIQLKKDNQVFSKKMVISNN